VLGKWTRRRALLASGIGVALLLIVALVIARDRGAVTVAQVPFSDLLHDLDRGAVTDVIVNGDSLDFKRTDGTVARTNAPANYVTANAAFVSDLAKKRVRIDVRTAPEQSTYSYGVVLLALAFLGMLGFMLYRVTSGRIPALESKTRQADRESSTVTFDDVAGVDEAKEEVKEIVDFLREPERFAVIGGRIPKGVLLVGPPGTGKTLLARSIAGEAKVPFLFASGSDFVEMYAGVGASRIR
jgi:cell division protease FtsH